MVTTTATKATKAKAPKPKKAAPKTKKDGKGGKAVKGGAKKKKQTLKFIIECKNPVEDGIMKINALVCIFKYFYFGGVLNLLLGQFFFD